MPTFIGKVCTNCLIEYSVVIRYKNKRFCSAACHQHYRKQVAKTARLSQCISCCLPLTKKSSIKFCSQSCSAIYNNNSRDATVHQKQSKTLKNTLVKKGLARTNKKVIYKIACKFKFNIYQYLNIPGFDLLMERGIHNYKTNKDGVVRDHIVSREYGWIHQIPVEIINHPANCQFITNNENVKKSADSHLSYDELIKRIQSWENNQGSEVSNFNKTVIKTSTKLT